MKKKYENFWKMYSNCLYNFEAFANKQKIPIAPQKFFLPMSKPYILHYTLYITLTLTLYFVELYTVTL